MKSEAQYVICIGNKRYAASLELRKLSQVLPDEAGAKHHQIRVVDESGEDYLYPDNYFMPLRLPQVVDFHNYKSYSPPCNLKSPTLNFPS